jgi:hypothetical protein
MLNISFSLFVVQMEHEDLGILILHNHEKVHKSIPEVGTLINGQGGKRFV